MFNVCPSRVFFSAHARTARAGHERISAICQTLVLADAWRSVYFLFFIVNRDDKDLITLEARRKPRNSTTLPVL